MPNAETDARFIEEALLQLQDYLLSEELFWPMGLNQPRLTPGALLLALTRLQASQPVQTEYWQSAFQTVRAQRPSAWKQKALKELRNRLRLWSASIGEWRSATAAQRADYAGAIRSRVILQLLLAEVDAPEEKAQLTGLDLFLQTILKKGEFLWEKEVQAAFDERLFWFLYGTLP